MADKKQLIHDEFKKGLLSYIDAIEELQKLGYSPREAEQIVSDWDDSK